MKNRRWDNLFGLPDIGCVLAALCEDADAMGELIDFYKPYIESCIIIRAEKGEMKCSSVSFEDIEQDVIVRYIMAIRKFRI